MPSTVTHMHPQTCEDYSLLSLVCKFRRASQTQQKQDTSQLANLYNTLNSVRGTDAACSARTYCRPLVLTRADLAFDCHSRIWGLKEGFATFISARESRSNLIIRSQTRQPRLHR